MLTTSLTFESINISFSSLFVQLPWDILVHQVYSRSQSRATNSPADGNLKVNVHACWDVATKQAGLGIIARDHRGRVIIILTEWKFLTGCCWGSREGQKHAVNLQCTEVDKRKKTMVGRVLHGADNRAGSNALYMGKITGYTIHMYGRFIHDQYQYMYN
jgi:hypothetical protein